ncbi:hypothetical protein MHN79_12875 [Vibrio sp. Of14-4]|uniref:hypothetical protein n=1 Tax=Vibrio sp. Of14-4 TaxID=2724878 RepID=UPI001EF304E0|nr:hypothetical protein [Vibrio sp. Of14-4]MCG7490383.1 hypothetical protein [Vibrio sp. Of14-4]
MSNLNSNVFDFVAHEIKVDKLIAQSVVTPYMSNAKWRKCFRLLNEVAPDIQVIWKFVGSQNDGVRGSLPTNEAIGETYLSNRFWFGPTYYKEIEWLDFPELGKPYGKEKIPVAWFEQDVSSVVESLNKIGRWHIVKTDLGFRLYGYQ